MSRLATRLPARLPLFSMLIALPLAACGAGHAPSGPEEALSSIGEAGVRAHIRFLADDLLEGRGTGSVGYDIAAAYVAARFEALGLEPAGEEGSFYQPVPLRRSSVAEGSRVVLHADGGQRVLELSRDVALGPGFLSAEEEVRAPVVFVGYGTSDPKHDYDDYAGIDVTGKLVAMIGDAPPSLAPSERAHFSSQELKAKRAAEAGAVGMVMLRTAADDERFSWRQLTRLRRAPRYRWLGRDGAPADVEPALRASLIVNHELVPELFAAAGTSWQEALANAEAGRAEAFPLDIELEVRTVSQIEEVSSPNVAARLTGSDPALADELVVMTAHLDHEGIGEPVDGDAIYNGAVDNAAGTACLLEIARAFSRLETAPRRSVLFLAVAAEEQGLLGADYFAHHPTVPIGSIVANVNMDGATIFGPPSAVAALGADHSSLGAVAEGATARLGLRLSPDPAPEQHFFIRSDQYPFVKKGVPALFYFPTGDDWQAVSEWLVTRYHTPSDDFEQPLDFAAAATFARLNFLTVWEILQAEARPAWNQGDFFGDTFGGGV